MVFSGFGSQAMIDRAISLGAAGYIKKGADLQTIPEVLARSTELAP